ncbi:hypothetical protein FIBSPDRAFT_962073 [Athelia psychrophila]|uniref:DUF6533 domain-containing protein n=1 Tax=Athelia psychrophila TaxID=1759441 RepID=A0A166AJE2_9AGAM|nr:hypothetical protein FIBSPDRAFT_962073 [Fibularhizoctonia sp. CBS 109695]
MSTYLETTWRLQLIAYVFMANTTMYAYDWALSVSDEVKLVSVAGLSWPIAIYFLSRANLFLLICINLLFRWLPPAGCDTLVKISGVCTGFSIASTSFLFLLRIRAVYLRSARITAVFGTLWLVTVAFAIQSAATIQADPKPLYVYSGCSVIHINFVDSRWLLVIPFLNDTSIFLAITYRLTADAVTAGRWRSDLLSMVTGKGLYKISRSIMLTGQLYYFSTIAHLLVHFAILWHPPAHGTMYLLAALYAGYTNMMACRVFRGVALGLMHMGAAPAGLTSTRIAAAFELALIPP